MKNKKVQKATTATLDIDFFVLNLDKNCISVVSDAINILKVSLPNFTKMQIQEYLKKENTFMYAIYGHLDVSTPDKKNKIVFGSMLIEIDSIGIHVIGIGIIPKYRNCGFGKILLQTIMTDRVVRLLSDKSSIGFYKHIGFVCSKGEMKWEPVAFVRENNCKLTVLEFNTFLKIVNQCKHVICVWIAKYDQICSSDMKISVMNRLKAAMIDILDSENSLTEQAINKIFD